MFDIAIIGAGISGASFAKKISKIAKTLLVEARDYKTKIPTRTNIFAEHNHPYIEESIWNDKSIFPLPYAAANYMGDERDGIISGEEFGKPLGKVCHTNLLIKKYIHIFEENGGEFHNGEKIQSVNTNSDYVEIKTKRGETYKTKLLVLATGSKGFELQRSLGFKTPDSYKGICMHLYGEESQLQKNFNFQYCFHINPNISRNGPFFINRGKGRIFVGFLGDRQSSEPEFIDKLDRILSNYKRIQPFLQGLKRDEQSIVIDNISKHPIPRFSTDRVLVLGEAAGLVTSFFYEGMLCGLVSADIAFNLVKKLMKSKQEYSRENLRSYDEEINRILLNNYFRNGDASEYLFYNDGSYVRDLWNEYVELLTQNKTVRKYLWEAHINHDLANHKISNDRYVGEKLFGKLSTFTKIALGGRFFKAMLK
ncbi:MAG: Monomeric sarcosine oxidase [Promethearchaeota archaeon]|nr:MAG: Monomeric sarcosine oxidase [Candidatus Lokiarchaeota archaeon]